MKILRLDKRFAVILLLTTVIFSMVGCKREETTSFSDSQLSQIATFLIDANPEPVCGTVGGEWLALGLARWEGLTDRRWLDEYYAAVENYVISCGGILHDRKYTEYSRVVLGLTAIGKDPQNVGGYNLLEPLADFEQTVFQGVNGAAFALLALDCGAYEIPTCTSGGTQATREMYVDHILSKECSTGGWSLAGNGGEVDMTAMVLQALAKYRDRQDVSDAVERALLFLSQEQDDLGGYSSYDSLCSESVSQVIVALTELGISMEDPRFVKNGNTLPKCLMAFMTEDNGFCHILGGEMNLISTEQAFYALVSLKRMDTNQSSLYTMAAS